MRITMKSLSLAALLGGALAVSGCISSDNIKSSDTKSFRHYLSFVEESSKNSRPEHYLGSEKDYYVIRMNDGNMTKTYRIEVDKDGRLYQDEKK